MRGTREIGAGQQQPPALQRLDVAGAGEELANCYMQS